MMAIKTTDDIKQLGTILGVWAHPDDETFCMGGILAAADKNDQRVGIVTATRGEAGVQDESRWPAAKLGQIRTEELAAALEILGVTENHWLDCADGCCKDADQDEVVGKLSVLIEEVNPDSIFTFGAEGMTGHDDHRTVSAWASLAAKKANSKAKIYHPTLTKEQLDAASEADSKLNLFFNIDNPPVCEPETCAIYFNLGEELCSLKLKALLAMPSQYAEMAPFFEKSLKITFGTEAFTVTN